VSRAKVLVVDDEPNECNALAALLLDDGYDVATAAGGREALEKLALFQAQVVITDLQMPGTAGAELVTSLRRRADPPLVIVMTEYGKKAIAVEALRAGARDYLTKPIRFDELLVVLGQAIEFDRWRDRCNFGSA
jgi:DNA-binding NtrC family response regulator